MRHLMLLLSGLLLASVAQAAETTNPDAWELPIATRTLDNGLTVVVSEDHSAPVVGVSVVYHVGMRLEPRDRTGFAHLF
jgi:predicted Zn-dependent peptidase